MLLPGTELPTLGTPATITPTGILRRRHHGASTLPQHLMPDRIHPSLTRSSWPRGALVPHPQSGQPGSHPCFLIPRIGPDDPQPGATRTRNDHQPPPLRDVSAGAGPGVRARVPSDPRKLPTRQAP